MSEQIVIRCEDSLEGIFTALFDAFVCKNKMKTPYTCLLYTSDAADEL